MIRKIFNLKDFIFQTSSLIFAGVITFLINIIIFRQNDLNLYSEFSFAISLGYILAIIIDAGSRNLILIRVPDPLHKKDKNFIYKIIFQSFLIFFLLSIFSIFFLDIKYFLIIINFFLINTCQQISFLFKARGNFYNDFIWQIFFRTSNFIFIIYGLTYINKNISTILILWSISSLISIIIYLNLNFINFFKIRNEIFVFIKDHLSKFVLPLFLIDLFISINLRSNVILMEYLNFNDEDISYFAAAFRVFEIILIIFSPIAIFAIRYFSKNEILINSLFKLLFQCIMFGSIIFIFFYFSSNFITNLLYKDIDQNISPILKFLTVSYIFILPSTILCQYFLSKKKHIILSFVFVISYSVSLVTNYYLLNIYSIYGAVYTLVIFEFIIFIVLTFILVKFILYEKNRY